MSRRKLTKRQAFLAALSASVDAIEKFYARDDAFSSDRERLLGAIVAVAMAPRVTITVHKEVTS